MSKRNREQKKGRFEKIERGKQGRGKVGKRRTGGKKQKEKKREGQIKDPGLVF